VPKDGPQKPPGPQSSSLLQLLARQAFASEVGDPSQAQVLPVPQSESVKHSS
jgi:hypothetical protein